MVVHMSPYVVDRRRREAVLCEMWACAAKESVMRSDLYVYSGSP